VRRIQAVKQFPRRHRSATPQIRDATVPATPQIRERQIRERQIRERQIQSGRQRHLQAGPVIESINLLNIILC